MIFEIGTSFDVCLINFHDARLIELIVAFQLNEIPRNSKTFGRPKVRIDHQLS